MARGKLKVGIVGTGFGRSVQIPGFQQHPETEVVAICSQHRERAEAVAREFGIPHAFDDYRAMLELRRLDIVSIATPPYLHLDMTIAALEAGKHVLCEKPMAMDAREAETMCRAAEATGCIAMLDHEYRFAPVRAWLKELVDDGYLGHLRSVGTYWVSNIKADPIEHPWGWFSQKEKGGGAMGAAGSHEIDLMLWWFGGVASCLGRYETLITERQVPGSTEMRRVETEDWLTAVVDFERGGEGVLTVNIVAQHGLGLATEMYGTQGTLIADRAGRLFGARRGVAQLEELPVPECLKAAPGAGGSARIDFLWVVERMVRAIRDGEDSSPSFRDGLRCQRVIDAISLSAQAGRPMVIPSEQPA